MSLPVDADLVVGRHFERNADPSLSFASTAAPQCSSHSLTVSWARIVLFEYPEYLRKKGLEEVSGNPNMRIKVKLFASFRDIVGAKEEDLTVPDGTTVQQLLENYIARFPQMAKFREHIILSVNRDYGAPARVLRDGDEVSFLPPVSGG